MSKIWAIADLHLSFGTVGKSMDIFNPLWKNHHQKIQMAWDERINPTDLVLIAGDISWAMRMDHAIPDLEWIHQRPGTKVLIKGNHDLWWGSLNKVQKALPPSLHVIQNTAFHWNDISIAGTRLWDTQEYSFEQLIAFRENTQASKKAPLSEAEIVIRKEENEKIYSRELQRLEISLGLLQSDARLKIAMTHYPPIGWDLKPSRVSLLLEQFEVKHCVFGHLHSLKEELGSLFGEKSGVNYHLTSCDWLNFIPLQIE